MLLSPKRLVFALVFVMAMTSVLCKVKKEKTRRATKEKKPRLKLNLRVLTARLIALEEQVKVISDKVNRVDSAQGLFSDNPPCPMKSAKEFYVSTEIASCYKMEPTTMLLNFTEAQAHCKTLHPKSHLVAIETEAEQKFLKAKWFNECGVSSISRFWTDGSKEGKDEWFWESANNPVKLAYTNWISTTTHDDERFSCIAVYASEAYAWGDVACWAPHVVTCEIEL